MSAGLGKLVVHTSLAKDTTPPDQPGREAHSSLKGCRFNRFNNFEKLELKGTMQFLIFFQDGLIDPAFTLVRRINVFRFHLNQETPFVA
jgi:hypothetical protein